MNRKYYFHQEAVDSCIFRKTTFIYDRTVPAGFKRLHVSLQLKCGLIGGYPLSGAQYYYSVHCYRSLRSARADGKNSLNRVTNSFAHRRNSAMMHESCAKLIMLVWSVSIRTKSTSSL